MANVVVLLFRLHPEVFRVLATPLARATERRPASLCRHGWRYVMSLIAAYRAVPTGAAAFLAIISFCVTSCTTVLHHEFSDLFASWKTESGQLMYRTPNTTLIGEVFVRVSKAGDFELTMSKGPGITLLSLRQDATFADVKGGLARQGWSGPVAHAPSQLRGWLGLREQFLHAPDRKTLRYTAGNETFVFRF
jgi:hypothetical protein